MSADSLYQSILGYLEVRPYALRSSISGNEINVDEEFTLRVFVRNCTPANNNHPDIVFRNIRVNVRATEYATPVTGNSETREPDDSVLTRGGDGGKADFPMRATKAIFDAFGPIPGIPEKVATVRVIAEIDQDRFFRIRKNVDAFTDILRT